jgi:hypothetical protein
MYEEAVEEKKEDIETVIHDFESENRSSPVTTVNRRSRYHGIQRSTLQDG